MPFDHVHELLRRRLEPLVVKLPAEEPPYRHDGYDLLAALAGRTPDTAEAVFRAYLRDAGLQRHRTVCTVLYAVKVPWDAAVLLPPLDDAREATGEFQVYPYADVPRLRVRVCDAAATALARHRPDLTFTLTGRYPDLDRQIATIRSRLAPKK